MNVRFFDSALQERLETDGFVVVPLLGSVAVEHLRVQYDEISDPVGVDLRSSAVGRGADENLRRSARIVDTVMPRLAGILAGFDVMGAVFLTKPPGKSSGMALHQDWTVVDEVRHASLNVWCALSDVNEADGPLDVLPGSHRWFRTYRGPSRPSVEIAYGPSSEYPVRSLPVRSGDAVVYDHRLFHGSRPNTTRRARVVAQLGLSPTGARLTMCEDGEGADTVRMREVERSVFFGSTDATIAPGRSWLVRNVPTVTAQDVVDRARHRHLAEAPQGATDVPGG